MTDDQTLTDLFATLERDRPDADLEFTALTTRLDGLGRRRAHRAAGGAVAVTGLAAALVVGTTQLADDPAARPDRSIAARPAVSSRPASSPSVSIPRVRQVAFSTNIATVTGADGVERPVVTVDAGWLPDGASVTSVSADTVRDGGGSERRWLVAYPDGGLGGYYVSVVRSSDHELFRGEIRGTTGSDLTVQGHPARLYDVHWGAAVHQVIIAVDFGQGRIYRAETFFETAKLESADAVAVTKHVAETMKVDQRAVLPVTARLTAAPAGAQIVDAYAVFDDTVYSDHFTMTFYRLNNDSNGAQIGIGGLAEKYPAPIKGEAGRPVQGKPTVIIRDQGHIILYIKGLFGEYTKIISGAGAETVEDLYTIADGIRAVS